MPPPGRRASDAEWFDGSVKPDAPIASYAAAPPRGMTNAPQNPLVRTQLLNDLHEYGVQMEVPVWPPPRRKSSGAVDVGAMDASFRRSSTSTAGAWSRRSSAAMSQSGFGRSRASSMAATSQDGEEPRRRKPQPIWAGVKDEVAHNVELDAFSMSRGSPTVRWRTPAVVEENRRKKEEAAAIKAIKEGSAFKKKPERIPSDDELNKARQILKGQSGMHSAFLADRFKYSSDMSKGAPMVIGGSSLLSGTNTNSWSSDAASLIAFHNGALRMVNPPALQPLPEEAAPKKKKKSKDDDHLEMSSTFKPRYPVDDSLKSLRKLKKKMFPQEVAAQEEARRRASAELAQVMNINTSASAPTLSSGFSASKELAAEAK